MSNISKSKEDKLAHKIWELISPDCRHRDHCGAIKCYKYYNMVKVCLYHNCPLIETVISR